MKDSLDIARDILDQYAQVSGKSSGMLEKVGLRVPLVYQDNSGIRSRVIGCRSDFDGTNWTILLESDPL